MEPVKAGKWIQIRVHHPFVFLVIFFADMTLHCYEHVKQCLDIIIPLRLTTGMPHFARQFLWLLT